MRIRVLILALCLLASSASAEEASVCTRAVTGAEVKLTLTGIEDPDWESLCVTMVEYLRLPEGPFTEAEVALAERLLQGPGYFAEAGCVLEGEGETLACTLTPAPMVFDFDFEGDVPSGLLTADLRRRVFLRPGPLFEDEKVTLARQQRRLESYLEEEGYFGSTVRISTEAVDKARPNQGLRLIADVAPGRKVGLRQPVIEGDLPAGWRQRAVDRRFRHYLLLRWFPERFRPVRFEEDLEELEKALREDGHPEARVSGDWKLDLANEEAQPQVKIELGPRLDLIFHGNDQFRDAGLESLTTFFESGVVDPIEVETSAHAIRKAYQERGYYEAKIAGTISSPAEGVLTVTFQIDEGARGEIETISFAGNASISGKDILERLELLSESQGFFSPGRWVDEHVAADARAIKNLYKGEGYAAAKVDAELVAHTDDSLELVFTVDEGPVRRVVEMTLEGLPEDVERESLLGRLYLRSGRAYVHGKLGTDRREILATLNASGYPRAVVKRDMVRPKPSEGGDVRIHYHVKPGPRSLFGGVLVRGNFRTVRALIDQEIGLKNGEPLDVLALGSARQSLRRLGPFDSVELAPLDLWRDDELTWLLVAVQERERRTLDLVLTFSTNELFSLGPEYQDHNLFGRAIRFDASARIGRTLNYIPVGFPIGRVDSVEANLGAPRPFNAPFDVRGRARWRHQDFPKRTETDETGKTIVIPAHDQQEIGVLAGVLRNLLVERDCTLCPRVDGSLNYEVTTRTREVTVINPTTGENERQDNSEYVGKIYPALNFDRRDSPLDPKTGYSGSARVELAHKALSPIYGSTFWRVQASLQGYLTLGTPFAVPVGEVTRLGGPIVVAAGGTFGYAHPFGGDSRIPYTEGYSYGGDTVVRGVALDAAREVFEYASVGTWGSAELRWYVVQNLGFGTIQLAGFVDWGSVGTELSSLGSGLTLTAGPVLRYVTPVGPFSFIYGTVIQTPDPRIGTPGKGQFHFTFGYSF